jgi:hypothetical protein
VSITTRLKRYFDERFVFFPVGFATLPRAPLPERVLRDLGEYG